MDDCLFCKIVSGEIPSAKVYEDDVCYAFDDIEPEDPSRLDAAPVLPPVRQGQGVEDIGDGAGDVVSFGQRPSVGFVREGTVAIKLKLGEDVVGGG